MANEPTLTPPDFESGVPRPYETLSGIQRAYVDWKALDGMITDDEGVHYLTLEELGVLLNPDHPVLKQTIAGSCRNIPNFWEMVTERRKLFGNTSRLAYVHRQWYVKAALMKNWPLAEAWLRNFDPNYREAKTKVEHELGEGFADLIASKRKNKVIEAEVVDAQSNS